MAYVEQSRTGQVAMNPYESSTILPPEPDRPEESHVHFYSRSLKPVTVFWTFAALVLALFFCLVLPLIIG